MARGRVITEMAGSASGNIVEKLSLYGILPAQALLAQFDSGQIAFPPKRDDLLTAWTGANSAYLARANPSASFVGPNDMKDFDGVPKAQVTTTLQRLKNYPPFDSHHSQMVWAATNKLVTPQLTVTLPRLAKRATLTSSSTPDQLFKLMMEPGSSPEPVFRQTLGIAPNGGAILYTSYDEDIRLHQPPLIRSLPINEGDVQSPKLESICFPVGGGTPFAYAFRVQVAPGAQRLILANGIHRAAAAARAGVGRVPLAVCDLTPLEVPDPFVETPRGMLLDPNFSPPMVSDFADSQLAVKLSVYRPLRTVRFNWNFENYVVAVR